MFNRSINKKMTCILIGRPEIYLKISPCSLSMPLNRNPALGSAASCVKFQSMLRSTIKIILSKVYWPHINFWKDHKQYWKEMSDSQFPQELSVQILVFQPWLLHVWSTKSAHFEPWIKMKTSSENISIKWYEVLNNNKCTKPLSWKRK